MGENLLLTLENLKWTVTATCIVQAEAHPQTAALPQCPSVAL